MRLILDIIRSWRTLAFYGLPFGERLRETLAAAFFWRICAVFGHKWHVAYHSGNVCLRCHSRLQDVA